MYQDYCKVSNLALILLFEDYLMSNLNYSMSFVARKTAFCICENKDADQLCGNRKADQRLCFRDIDSTIPLLPKYQISSLKPSSVVAQPGLCRTWSESPEDRFSSHNEAPIIL